MTLQQMLWAISRSCGRLRDALVQTSARHAAPTGATSLSLATNRDSLA